MKLLLTKEESQMDDVLSAALKAYAHLERECHKAHRDARRNRRAFVFASAIALVLALALWMSLMIGR